ncbi:hypothetical protein ACOZ4F_20015 [Haloarcula marismortui]|uniref:hypothetical protein n=1 Tax=Haloarcula marismortui TaxID=2238 RepID=UPI003C711566
MTASKIDATIAEKSDEQNDGSEIEIDGAGVTAKSIDRGGRVDVDAHGDGVFVNIHTDYISGRLFLSPEQAAAIAAELEAACDSAK